MRFHAVFLLFCIFAARSARLSVVKAEPAGGIMISNVVFRFLGIPYQEFWHYVHFASGVAFLILVLIHMVNHRR